jgi:hypothetical protein
MSRFSINEERENLPEVWFFYRDCRYALLAYKSSILESLGKSLPPPVEFIGMTRDEVDEHFNYLKEKLEMMISLRLLSATDACICVDFIHRTEERKKDKLSKSLVELKKEKTRRNLDIKLDEILKIWRREIPALKKQLDVFSLLLEFRHWLAHGCYWTPKFGRKRSPEEIYPIVSTLVASIESHAAPRT